MQITLLAFSIMLMSPTHTKKEPTKYWVYVGTYTDGGAKGIYRCEFDADTGRLSAPMLAVETKNPSFLAIHPSGKFLYAVGEMEEFQGKKAGAVSAYAIDSASGALRGLNQQPSGGGAPCHLVVDKAGRHVLVANYSGGSTGVLPIEKDGTLGKLTSLMQHAGKSVHPQRQLAPHAHSINLDAANRYAFVADLGLDQIVVYQFDDKTGTLAPNSTPKVTVAPGGGPRHFSFHPNWKLAYGINELNSTVSVFEYDPIRGALKEIQTVSTLPIDFRGVNHTAEVVVHPSGKFVYGSNRGHDSVAVFAVEESSGKLTPNGHQTDRIKTPRNFCIDPSGSWMIVANQTGDDLGVFQIDARTGAIQPMPNRVTVSRPVCVRFLPRKS